MAISITTADVKRKCMIPSADTTYDTSINTLISEMQPAIEYTIADVHLLDTSNTRLQSLLKLGILEIISGEFLQQLAREYGNQEEFSIAGVTIGQMKDRGPELIQQGSSRLAPFLKCLQPMLDETAILSNTKGTEPIFSIEVE
ncbi:MAG TPA: hypothetical protein PLU88_13425 [Armatimonadota bacterium]|nr:hypothetical protein [Armatimonadota bacterium]HPP76118.1 hypothetical protein [Armatimonadota bacterium]